MKSLKLWIFCLVAFSQMSCGSDLETVFTYIFENKIWEYEGETVSGMGATLAYTQKIRKDLPDVFQEYGIRSILDIGCGDFNWMKHIITDDITYTGIDIVKKIIDKNSELYTAQNISFIHANCCIDPLPRADLVICRDVLAHFSYGEAFKLIENIKKSGSKYVLFTTYADQKRENNDLSQNQIGMSNYCLNMEKAPFSFLRPLLLINENCPSPQHVVTPDKSLGLWHLKKLDNACSAVTYLDDKNWGGRLGDKLLMYVKARWVAYKKNMPFYYKPFKYSDQLLFSEVETAWHENYAAHFDIIENEYKENEDRKKCCVDFNTAIAFTSTLHVIDYYWQPHFWGNDQKLYDSQDVSQWKELYDDEAFRTILRETIRPRFHINTIALPNDKITVALHVRKGRGFDGELLSLQLYGDNSIQTTCHCKTHHSRFVDVGYMLKFPPDQFYVDQIRYLSGKYNDAPLYIHLFTDDPDPQSLLERYAQAVGKSNISYGCREQGNHHDMNILDDLFNMTRFDCLIRSGSNFPQVAQLIGNFKIVLYPKQVGWRSVLNVSEVGEITAANE